MRCGGRAGNCFGNINIGIKQTTALHLVACFASVSASIFVVVFSPSQGAHLVRWLEPHAMSRLPFVVIIVVRECEERRFLMKDFCSVFTFCCWALRCLLDGCTSWALRFSSFAARFSAEWCKIYELSWHSFSFDRNFSTSRSKKDFWRFALACLLGWANDVTIFRTYSDGKGARSMGGRKTINLVENFTSKSFRDVKGARNGTKKFSNENFNRFRRFKVE